MKNVLLLTALLLGAGGATSHVMAQTAPIVDEVAPVVVAMDELKPVEVDQVTMVPLDTTVSEAAPEPEVEINLVDKAKIRFNEFVEEVSHYFDEGMAEAEAAAEESDTPTVETTEEADQ